MGNLTSKHKLLRRKEQIQYLLQYAASIPKDRVDALSQEKRIKFENNVNALKAKLREVNTQL